MSEGAPIFPLAPSEFNHYEGDILKVATAKAGQELAWPAGDVQIVTVKRNSRTDGGKDGGPVSAEYAQRLRDLFASDWTRVELHAKSSEAEAPPAKLPALTDLDYELDAAREEDGAPELVLDQWQERDEGKDERKDKDKEKKRGRSERQEAPRLPLGPLLFLPPLRSVAGAPERLDAPVNERLGACVLVTPRELVLAGSVLEPFFLTLWLWDALERRPVSEQLQVHVNTAEAMALMAPSPLATSKWPTAGLFPVDSAANAEALWLVAVVSKVLKGDVNDYLDALRRDKEKDRGKFVAEVQESVRRLADYRQPLAFGAVPLYARGKLAEGRPLFGQLLALESGSEEFVRAHVDAVVAGKAPKGKPLGTLHCDVAALDEAAVEALPGRIDVMARKCVPAVAGAPLVREVQMLVREPRIATTLVHNLYLRLLRLEHWKQDARNLALEVRFLSSDAALDGAPLPAVYAPDGQLVTEAVSHVWYHEKKPTFFDEFKIRLPVELLRTHHLLFTLVNVNCKPPKGKAKEVVREPVAYAFLPLGVADHFILQSRDDDDDAANDRVSLRGRRELPVALTLPANYVSLDVEAIPWADKAAIVVDVDIVSSLLAHDRHVDRLLRARPDGAEAEAAVQAYAQGADAAEVVQFLPALLWQLGRMLGHPAPRVQGLAFAALVTTLERAGDQRPEELAACLGQMVTMPPRPERLAACWAHALREPLSPAARGSLRQAPVLFALLARTLALVATNLDDDRRRHDRFSVEKDAVAELVRGLGTVLGPLVADPVRGEIGRLLALSLGHFLRVLAALWDRSHLFELVQTALVQCRRAATTAPVRLELQLLLLRALAESPHWVMLNVPVVAPLRSAANILEEHLRRHFLVGTILFLLDEAAGHSDLQGITACGHVLLDLLRRHDADGRISTQDSKDRVGALYFPYLVIVRLGPPSPPLIGQLIRHHATLTAKNLQRAHKDLLYLLFVYVLKGLPPSLLSDWWSKETERHLAVFFEILREVAAHFQYKGERYVRNLRSEQTLVFVREQQQELPRTVFKARTTVLSEPTHEDEKAKEKDKEKEKESKRKDKLRKEKEAEEGGGELIGRDEALVARLVEAQAAAVEDDTVVPEDEVRKEKALHHELDATMLTAGVAFLEQFQELLGQRSDVLEDGVGLIVALLRKPQSRPFLARALARLARLVPLMREALFATKNTACGELVFEVVRHMAAGRRATRDEAASLFVLLLQANFDAVRTVSRMRLQTTIAVTRLVGQDDEEELVLGRRQGHGDRGGRLVQSCQAATRHYAKSALVDAFGEPLSRHAAQLEERVARVLAVQAKMAEFEHDPEAIVALQVQRALELQDSPDERVVAMINLARLHEKRQCIEEAAQARIVAAALVFEYLDLLGRWETQQAPLFTLVCPNLAAILHMPPAHALAPLGDEICQSQTFTEAGFVQLLKEAIDLLNGGGYYESCVSAYQMMLPIFQETNDYRRQKECYEDLVTLTGKLLNDDVLKQRIFSNYYRVAFFGRKLGTLDGQEYIYKEPNTVLLTEFTDRIIKQFADKFGADAVVKLGNQPAVPERPDASKVYIQIGAVEPWFAPDEATKRNTDWKRVYDVRQFQLDQPFTRGGKTQQAATLEDQWIRRTVYETQHAFPHYERRVLVAGKQSHELSPIESATINIKGKVQALREELNSRNPRLKILQRELQGALIPQVNAGPLAITKSFLATGGEAKYDAALRAELADAVSALTRMLMAAVSINKKLIGPDQLALQQELERQLTAFRKEVAGYAIIQERKNAKERELMERESGPTKRGQMTLAESARTSRSKLIQHERSGSGSTDSGADSPRRKASRGTRRSFGPGALDALREEEVAPVPVASASSGTPSRQATRGSLSPEKEKGRDKEERKDGKEKDKEKERRKDTPTKQASSSSLKDKDKDKARRSGDFPPREGSSAKLKDSLRKESSSPTLKDKEPLSPTKSVADDGDGERLALVRQGIRLALDEVREAARRSGQPALAADAPLSAAVAASKALNRAKIELDAARDHVRIGDYPVVAPQGVDNLTLARHLTSALLDAVNRTLQDVEGAVPSLNQTQLLAVIKCVKAALGVFK